jgi:hypothetical protein
MLSGPQPLLTLEPLVEAVREGVEGPGWELSGLQKTTSHQFEGRWAGDQTRSAYLFFHPRSAREWASVDVFLDETSRGLSGNLALVVDACTLDRLGDVPAGLTILAEIAARALPSGLRTPLTLRLRLEDDRQAAAEARVEVRFKVRIPRSAFAGGSPAVSALCADSVAAFGRIASDPALNSFLDPGP